MKTMKFTKFVPTFGQTFWLGVLTLALFLLAWLVTYGSVDTSTVPLETCSTTWKQDDEKRKWTALSVCSFGKVESAFSDERDLYLLTTKGRHNQLSCGEVKYPSGTISWCKKPA